MTPVQFPFHTDLSIESLAEDEAFHILKQAIESANQTLASKEITVVFIKQLSRDPPKTPEALDVQYNMLLGICIDGHQEPIDIVDIKALDEKSVKSPEDLAQEITQKAIQHVAAKTTTGIVFTDSGSKIDPRLLKENHQLSIDTAGYLQVDGHRLGIQEEQGFRVLKAAAFRSYTISRWIEEENRIRIFDDYDLVRTNRKGMYIDLSKVHRFAVKQLVESHRESANGYQNGYYQIHRDTMSPQTLTKLRQMFIKIPSP